MNDSALSDGELVYAAAQGDRGAFDQIDVRYRPRLLRFLIKQAGNLQDAEDLTQLTLAKAYESISSLNKGESVGAWLYQISVRLVIDKRRKRELVTQDIVEDPVCLLRPDEILSQKESREKIWSDAERVLAPDEYAAIWLKYVERLSDKEIATVLGKSHGAVRTLQHRARSRLADVVME
ncbi:MAG: RNA polymerase sigma factor [Thermoguttaceae bacterium]